MISLRAKASFQNWGRGVRTGCCRLGKDDMVVGIVGNRHISVEDYAFATIGELEYPKHHQERFTIGY